MFQYLITNHPPLNFQKITSLNLDLRRSEPAVLTKDWCHRWLLKHGIASLILCLLWYISMMDRKKIKQVQHLNVDRHSKKVQIMAYIAKWTCLKQKVENHIYIDQGCSMLEGVAYLALCKRKQGAEKVHIV